MVGLNSWDSFVLVVVGFVGIRLWEGIHGLVVVVVGVELVELVGGVGLCVGFLVGFGIFFLLH